MKFEKHEKALDKPLSEFVHRLLKRNSINIRDELALLMLLVTAGISLPDEEDMAKKLHSSLVVIRNALDALCEVGYLTYYQNIN